MQKINIDVEVGGGYATSYRDLNELLSVCTARMLEPHYETGNSYGDSLTHTTLVTLNPEALKNAKAAYKEAQRIYLRDETRYRRPEHTFTRFMNNAICESLTHVCRCEHDCCVHWNQTASARRIAPRVWSVKLYQNLNV